MADQAALSWVEERAMAVLKVKADKFKRLLWLSRVCAHDHFVLKECQIISFWRCGLDIIPEVSLK